MNQPQTKQPKIPFKEHVGELTGKELELIYWLRTRFRFGEVTIEVREGQPFRIVKAYETHQF